MSDLNAVREHPSMPLAPIDESVRVPDSVKRAAEIANSFYAKPEEVKPDPAAEEAARAAAQAAAEEAAHAEAARAASEQNQEVTTQEVEPTENKTSAKTPANEGDWEHRYLSMKGRYDASQRTIGSMQEQMSQLGDELMRTQQMIQQRAPQAQPEPVRKAKLITEEDEKNYGNELIDLAKRAAREAVDPELATLRDQNDQLRNRLTQNDQRSVVQVLDSEVRDWRTVNKSPEFKNWLSLRDIYSGAVRQHMLNEAYSAANAPRVLAFFKGFLNETNATGQTIQDQARQPEAKPLPRVAAVDLNSLAAPGKARPAAGDSTVSVDKPIFTRTQIQQFYQEVRQGKYAGRDAEKNQYEQSIFAAQREGRIR